MEGYVYLMRLEQDKDPAKCLHKIGCSRDPGARKAQIQQGLPFELTLLHEIVSNDMYDAENYYHEVYDKYRTRGEWFALSTEAVVDFLTRDIFISE